MNGEGTWLLYGAAGHTGQMIARNALRQGHRPLLAGRNRQAVVALAEELDLPYTVLALDDPEHLSAALTEVDLVLNAAGPFLHTATRLARACVAAGVHYLDISNELQVFRSLYDLDEQAKQAGVAVIPGVGFGTVATNCLARYVSDNVGGAENLEVASRVASAQAGPGAAATMTENLPYGGWIRKAGQLEPQELFTGITIIDFPDGPCQAMPVPTGDLEAAFQATGAPNVIAYAASPPDLGPPTSTQEGADPAAYQSYGWARASGRDGSTAQAWLETGESYAFTVSASLCAVVETLKGFTRGAISPASAFGTDFVLTIEQTTRVDAALTNTHLGCHPIPIQVQRCRVTAPLEPAWKVRGHRAWVRSGYFLPPLKPFGLPPTRPSLGRPPGRYRWARPCRSLPSGQ